MRLLPTPLYDVRLSHNIRCDVSNTDFYETGNVRTPQYDA